MKPAFVRVPPVGLAEPEPPAPEPVPFPIRIVSDPLPLPSDNQPLPGLSPGKRSDFFYEAWDKFLAIEPKRAKSSSSAAKKIEEEKAAVARTPGDGLSFQENAATSWEQATAECKAKVAAIVRECHRLNQKYRDKLFDLEANSYCLQNLTGDYPKAIDNIDLPPWVKRVEDIFDGPQFFIDGASASDVHQGSGGDCWFLASLMAVSAKKELIDKVCVARDEQCGVYGFVFYRDGEWIHEVVDDKLYLRVGDDDSLNVVRDWDKQEKRGMSINFDEDKLKHQLQRGGEALYFSHCKSSETWLPLIEKAYAKLHGDYNSIEGGFPSEGIEDLTGGVGAVINPEDIMDKERFWREQISQVNKKYLFGGGSKSASSKGLIGSHAYAILEAWEEGDLRLLKLRNPWGDTEWEGDWSDGSKLWTAEMMTKLNHNFGDEGIFWMSYKDFLSHFPAINRVRLFDESWKTAQQWTCVNVPWTVDYLDTKFRLTVTERGPVVVVLSQPDDRYFAGVRGRFLFSMHFRMYREGEEDARWIVRSMHNSGNESTYTRSVSAEIEDLDPGTYSVVFKVTAARTSGAITAEDAIMKYAVEKKEKLLHVGRRFDYAQMKGNLRAMERAAKKEERLDKRTKMIDNEKMLRKLNQKEKERARRRKRRIEDAMKEKRKAYKMAKVAKERARGRRGLHPRAPASTDGQATADSEVDDRTGRAEVASRDQLATAVDGISADDSKETGAEVESSQPTEPIKHQTDTTKMDEEGNVTAMQTGDDAEEQLAKTMDVLKIDNGLDDPEQRRCSSVASQDDEEYESSIEPPEELGDDDFDWDSELDGPGAISDDDDEAASRLSRNNKDIFADDPWTALCVLGLRVYTLNSEAQVTVVKGDRGS